MFGIYLAPFYSRRAFALCGAVFGLAMVGSMSAADTRQITSGIGGSHPDNDSGYPRITADGRYVVYASAASNIVPNDTNNAADIFLYDRVANTTELISVNSQSQQANGRSINPVVSPDGRYVAFDSEATNLTSGPTNGFSNVYLRDRVANTTELISVNMTGKPAIYGADSPGVSPDGRYVVFISGSYDLVPNDTNSDADIFLRDRQTGKTERVSVTSEGKQANIGIGGYPSVSADGRYVVFDALEEIADGLVPNDDTNVDQVFLRDRQTGATTLLSKNSAGVYGDDHSEVDRDAITSDGKYVVFDSGADHLIDNDNNGERDIFLYTIQTGQLERVSVGAGGLESNGSSGYFGYQLSPDGRYFVFASAASNLVPGVTNKFYNVYWRDRARDTIERVGLSTRGDEPSYSDPNAALTALPAVSADGRYVAFQSSGLTPGTTLPHVNLFLRDRGQSPTTLSGTLTFEGIASLQAIQNVTFEFRPTDGGAPFQQVAHVLSDGAFALFDLPRQAFTVHIKGDKYLAVNAPADLGAGDLRGLAALLPAGDANNDNFCDTTDFGLLVGAYGSGALTPGSGYDFRADFNSDGFVDTTDFGLLVGNYGAMGDL